MFKGRNKKKKALFSAIHVIGVQVGQTLTRRLYQLTTLRGNVARVQGSRGIKQN